MIVPQATRHIRCLVFLPGALALALVVLGVPVGHASSNGVESKALLWSALDSKVKCGLANRDSSGPEQLLCFARPIPAPKKADPSIGDPGFVYLEATGRPQLARISQYSWEKGKNYGESQSATALSAGDVWKRLGLGVTCVLRKASVRCTNQAHHGFKITRSGYRAF